MINFYFNHRKLICILLYIEKEIVAVCRSQGLQSANENKSAQMRQGSNAVRDTANLQSWVRQ